MKILLDHTDPFLLTHGGFQVQIEQIRGSLQGIGVEVDYLRWWDGSQTADLIHFFGRPSLSYIELAHKKGIKIITAELLTGVGSRPRSALWTQRSIIRLATRFLPPVVTTRYAWKAFRESDASVALTEWEAHLMRYVFGAPSDRVHVVPNGVEEEFLTTSVGRRGPYLVCTATITERKRVLELSKAAVAAKTPLWIIGRPYAESDGYAQRFVDLARRHADVIRYEGPINDRAKLAQVYREARGFVLLSTMESLSLSALEAAACRCPLLLSDLPWARTVFGDAASYCPATSSSSNASTILRKFYDAADQLPVPPQPLSWTKVASQLQSLYKSTLGRAQ